MSGPAGRLPWFAAALLAVAVAASLAWPQPEAGPVRPAPLPRPAPGAAPIEAVAGAAAMALARPLFTPGRRPEAVAAGPAPDAAGRPEPPRLTGILLTPGGRSAIFAPSGSVRATVVTEGGRVGPWRVVAIHAADVQLAGPDGPRTVRPAYSEAPAATGVQLPLAAQADTRPLALPLPPGFATFPNAPALPAARTPQ